MKSFTDTTEIKNFHDFNHKYSFQAYVDKNIDSVFYFLNTQSVKSENNKYLIFSKPIGESLIVLEKFGDYKSVASSNGYYFGSATKYLFIFDSQNKIKEVYSTEISFN